MRIFYEEWRGLFENRPLATDDLEMPMILMGDNNHIAIRPLTTDKLSSEELEAFLTVGFSNHYEILAHVKDFQQRLFYVGRCATGFWSVKKLLYYLGEDLYSKEGTMPNNFALTITDTALQQRALNSFKDEYFLDFINIEDPDEIDERVLEQQIVHNIKDFIMALGRDFSFIGNQYRLMVAEKEYFIDLLFFNRRLQSLVAIELKRGEFKPEYAGKLNFYLSALDEYVKLPNENPSIGIILCKDKNTKTVEFAFRDINKPMGVATYKTSSELPREYRGILPEPEELRKLM
jgi:predicted nuclease of restriction endonuclease-like (RecB) superfamily